MRRADLNTPCVLRLPLCAEGGFFIFFDAKLAPVDLQHKNSLEKYSPKGYNICPDEDWCLNHINQKTFNPSVPNVLLKSVEEPPLRTTFVFLTKNRADLLNTIVSRSQCFKLPTAQPKQDFKSVLHYLENYRPVIIQLLCTVIGAVAATVISRASLEKVRARSLSCAPLRCIIFLN